MIEVTNETFEDEVMESETPVVVDFWAPWCGPCKTLTPLLDDLATEFEGKVKFVKVNVDTTTLAKDFEVRAVPTLALVKRGVVVDTLVGAHPRSKLNAWLMINL